MNKLIYTLIVPVMLSFSAPAEADTIQEIKKTAEKLHKVIVKQNQKLMKLRDSLTNKEIDKLLDMPLAAYPDYTVADVLVVMPSDLDLVAEDAQLIMDNTK